MPIVTHIDRYRYVRHQIFQLVLHANILIYIMHIVMFALYKPGMI